MTTVEPAAALAWGTAGGASITAQDGEPAPTIIALAETAGGTGSVPPPWRGVVVQPGTAAVSGSTPIAVTAAVSAIRRPRAGTPVVAGPQTHAGAPQVVHPHAGNPVPAARPTAGAVTTG